MPFFVFQTSEPRKYLLRITSSSGRNIPTSNPMTAGVTDLYMLSTCLLVGIHLCLFRPYMGSGTDGYRH